ncbi:CAP domain-containing protein [Bacillus sp. FJAT-42376]|uniref:CAP domain-containing protein n=1 Tax=Bacillus sp. FJAT-42376 TaxID=2014076 RepID=UPI000F4D57E9|nr:CAP domain-containing protein [Bacillus sp. FJAT-42376]AZB42494.1 CAP domain-containing protein [Bacillus sp. FJAT-42376]
MKKKKLVGLGLGFMLALGVLPAQEVHASVNSTAVQQGEKLAYQLRGFNKLIESGDIYDVNRSYDSFSRQIQAAEKAVGRVSGSSKRKALSKKYVTPAKVARERVIYEVSQYRLMKVIGKDALLNRVTYVDSNLKKLDRLKKRAVEIKKAGKYKAVPAVMTGYLSETEKLQKTNRFAVPDLSLNHTLTSDELDSFLLLNQDRYRSKKPLMTLSEKLSYIAQMKSKDMHSTGILSQYSSKYGDVGQMIMKFGFQQPNEAGILVYKFTTASNAKAQRELWRNNASLKNVLYHPAFNYAGVGSYRSYATHLFVNI